MNEAHLPQPPPEQPVAKEPGETAREFAARLLAAARRISRYPLAGGLLAWTVLLTVAYLAGTLVIAPMISEAAGLGSGVYSVDSTPRAARPSAEPVVQISPIASAATSSPSPAPAEKPAKEKRKRHRRHRRERELPADVEFIGHRRQSDGDDSIDSPARHEPSDDEQKDFRGGGEDGGARDDPYGGVQGGERIGDG